MKLAKLNISVALFIFSILWYLSLVFVFKNSYETIDPCSSTPSIEFTNTAFIVPIIFIILYFLLNSVVKGKLYNGKKHLFIILVLSLVPLIASYITYTLLENNIVKNLINKNNINEYFYTIGCYSEFEVNTSGLYLLSSLFHFLLSYILFLLISKKKPI